MTEVTRVVVEAQGPVKVDVQEEGVGLSPPLPPVAEV